MALDMLGNLNKDVLRDMVKNAGRMVEAIKDIGNRIKCMVKES